jgi:hypothetical protein
MKIDTMQMKKNNNRRHDARVSRTAIRRTNIIRHAPRRGRLSTRAAFPPWRPARRRA